MAIVGPPPLVRDHIIEAVRLGQAQSRVGHHLHSMAEIEATRRCGQSEHTGGRNGRGHPLTGPSRLGGNLDRQSDCPYPGGKQALTSLTSLRLAGHASIAAALRFHAAAQIAHCERS